MSKNQSGASKSKNAGKTFVGAWVDKKEKEKFLSEAKKNHRSMAGEIRHRLLIAFHA